MLPAGLMPTTGLTGEFFAGYDARAYTLLNGGVVTPGTFTPQLVSIVTAHMALHPKKVLGIREMGITDPVEMMNQYLVCNYGGFDCTPDIIDGVMQSPEFWPCPKRGTCKQEGVVCDGLRANNGEYLTNTEIRIIKRIALGDLDKEIAHSFGIAESTVATHTRNIRRKTGLRRKADFTRFATLKQLI